MTRSKLVISGASGVVGRHIISAAQAGYDISSLTREVGDGDPAGVKAVKWNPQAAKEDDEAGIDAVARVLEGAKALVNLAGAPIDDGRLDEAHKQRVLQSRVDSTNTLVAAFERCDRPPEVWFQASAVGYYGDRGDEVLTEDAAPQDGFFLAEVAKAWEAAVAPIRGKARLVIGRFGLVLAKDAPAWQKMLMPIKLFVGGPLGSGQQYYPWIDADDLARGVLFLIEHADARGVYNFSAPNPVRQIELARKAAEQLGRPAFMPAPSFALELVLGNLANALLLPSARVIPERLEQTGFRFEQTTIEQEMEKLL